MSDKVSATKLKSDFSAAVLRCLSSRKRGIVSLRLSIISINILLRKVDFTDPAVPLMFILRSSLD